MQVFSFLDMYGASSRDGQAHQESRSLRPLHPWPGFFSWHAGNFYLHGLGLERFSVHIVCSAFVVLPPPLSSGAARAAQSQRFSVGWNHGGSGFMDEIHIRTFLFHSFIDSVFGLAQVEMEPEALLAFLPGDFLCSAFLASTKLDVH